MLVLRKTLFCIFLILYLILCPILIAYALGYIFKPGDERGLVKTGLIYLATIPDRATVYVGNKRFAKKTPAVIRNLLPGDYEVKLVLKKHRLWTQNVPVEAEKATALEKVLLLPTKWGTEQLVADHFEKLIPIKNNHFFLLTKGETAGDLYFYDWKEKRIRPLFSKNSTVQSEKVDSIFTIDQSPALLLRLTAHHHDRYLRIEIKSHKPQVMDLSNLFSEHPAWVSWDPKEKDYLFTFQGGFLNRLDIASYEMYPRFINDPIGFGLADKETFVLKTDGLIKIDLEGKTREMVSQKSFPLKLFLGQKQFFEIKPLAKDIFIFRGKEHGLFTNIAPYTLSNDEVRGVELDEKNERVLVWNKHQLGILTFAKEETGNLMARIKNRSASLIWVFKKGSDIAQADWIYEGSHILFLNDDLVSLLEPETYGKPHLNPVARVQKNSAVFYSEESGKLYYLEPETGYLSSIEILPKWEILPRALPEVKEQKKKSQITEL